MIFTFKRIFLVLSIFSCFVVNVSAIHNQTTPASKKLSDVQTLVPLFFVMGLITNALGLGLITSGIAHAYDIPSSSLDRIAHALQQNPEEQYNRQKNGRRIIGSILGISGAMSLVFGIINWALIPTIVYMIKQDRAHNQQTIV